MQHAVDSEGEVLDLLAQPRRDKATALKPLRKLLKKQGCAPRVLVTDELRSFAAAERDLGIVAPHDQGLRVNNRAENSHQPVRRDERKMTVRLPDPLRDAQREADYRRHPPSGLVRGKIPPRMSCITFIACDHIFHDYNRSLSKENEYTCCLRCQENDATRHLKVLMIKNYVGQNLCNN